MKGSPLLRAGWVVIFLAVVAWPVRGITHRSAKPTPHVAASPTSASTTSSEHTSLHATMLLHGAPDPLTCAVVQEGRILLSEKNRIGPGEYRSTGDLSPGTDLLVSATWSDRDPHALRLEVLVRDDLPPLQKDYWARESLEDAFVLPDLPSTPVRP